MSEKIKELEMYISRVEIDLENYDSEIWKHMFKHSVLWALKSIKDIIWERSGYGNL